MLVASSQPDEKDRVIAIASKKGNLYYLNCVNVQRQSRVYIAANKNESIWHKRFGHLGEKYLQQLAKEKLVNGFVYDMTQTAELCESCVKGKLHKSKFPNHYRKKTS